MYMYQISELISDVIKLFSWKNITWVLDFLDLTGKIFPIILHDANFCALAREFSCTIFFYTC